MIDLCHQVKQDTCSPAEYGKGNRVFRDLVLSSLVKDGLEVEYKIDKDTMPSEYHVLDINNVKAIVVERKIALTNITSSKGYGIKGKSG